MKSRFILRKRDFSGEEGHLPQDDLSQELVGLKPHPQLKRYERDYPDEDFIRDYTDKDLPVYSTEPEATRISDLKKPTPTSRFNWAAFWTMLASIIVVVILIIFVPGPFDEIGATIVLGAINFFISNYRK